MDAVKHKVGHEGDMSVICGNLAFKATREIGSTTSSLFHHIYLIKAYHEQPLSCGSSDNSNLIKLIALSDGKMKNGNYLSTWN